MIIEKTNIAYQTPKPWRSPLRHDQSIFAPCLLASSHSMAPRGNETKARAWDGTSTKKMGCTKSLVMPHPLGLFDDVPCSFSRHLRIHFVESFSILWLGSSMVHPVHPDSFTFFLISKTFACRNFALLPYHQTFACIMDCGEMMGWEMGGDGWGWVGMFMIFIAHWWSWRLGLYRTYCAATASRCTYQAHVVPENIDVNEC